MDHTENPTSCPTPTKSRFATREAADSSASRNALAVGKPLRPYRCVPACGWWHLTSKQQSPAAPDPGTVAAVAALTDREFRDLVSADIAGKATPVEAGALRRPEVAARWAAALKQVEVSLMAQLVERRSEVGPDVDVWRARVHRKRGWVASRREEARELLRVAALAGQEAAHRAAVERKAAAKRAAAAAGEEARRANPEGAAGEAAIKRLIEAHRREFTELLAEEYAAAGLVLPARVARHLEAHRAVAS